MLDELMNHLLNISDFKIIKKFLDLMFLFINKIKNIRQDDIFNQISKHFRNNK